MSDRPIQVGDLVMVVRGCCPHNSWGVPWQVKSTVMAFNAHCIVCGKPINEQAHALGAFAAPVTWLKRIDPPATGDSLPTRRELEETA